MKTVVFIDHFRTARTANAFWADSCPHSENSLICYRNKKQAVLEARSSRGSIEMEQLLAKLFPVLKSQKSSALFFTPREMSLTHPEKLNFKPLAALGIAAASSRAFGAGDTADSPTREPKAQG